MKQKQTKKEPGTIWWKPELTEQAAAMTDEFLAQLFAPIIREMIEEEARTCAGN